MAREIKIAHDYFLDCCKKYGIEVVNDKKVRSHFETSVSYNGYTHTEKGLSVYGAVGDKKTGIRTFRNFMADYYLHIGNPEKSKEWLHGQEDILYTPKAKESDLKEIYKLLDKALTIANKSDKDAVPTDVFEAISIAVGTAHNYLLRRGEA